MSFVQEGQEEIAAFLETRRYAALKGATTQVNTSTPNTSELYIIRTYNQNYSFSCILLLLLSQFSKWEGITYSPSRKQVFTAMSEIRKGMEDNMYKGEEDPEYDVGTTNDVKVPYNSCGCIYVMDVEDDSNIKNMKGMLCGSPQSDDELNTCSIDGTYNSNRKTNDNMLGACISNFLISNILDANVTIPLLLLHCWALYLASCSPPFNQQFRPWV